MANKYRSEMILQFAGDPIVYAMVYDFNSLCLAEKLSGENLLNPSLQTGISASAMRALMFAFLYKKHGMHGMTMDEVGTLFDKGENYKIFAAVMELVQYGVSSEEEDPAAGAAPPAPEVPAKPQTGEEILAGITGDIKAKEAEKAAA